MNKKQCDQILRLLKDKGDVLLLSALKLGRGSYRLDNDLDADVKEPT